MEYTVIKTISDRLTATNFAAFGGDAPFAVDRITECVRCTEAYLTACMIAGVHARLETGVPSNVEAAWKEAKAAIEEMNALCRTLGLPDFLPEEPEAARQVLAERRRAILAGRS